MTLIINKISIEDLNMTAYNEYGKPVKVFLNEEIILDDYLIGEIVNPRSHYFTEESIFTKKVFDSVGQEWLYSYQFDVYFKVNEVEIYE